MDVSVIQINQTLKFESQPSENVVVFLKIPGNAFAFSTPVITEPVPIFSVWYAPNWSHPPTNKTTWTVVTANKTTWTVVTANKTAGTVAATVAATDEFSS